MDQYIEWKDIKNVYLHYRYLSEHPITTPFSLRHHSDFIEVDVFLGKDSHKLFLSVMFLWQGERCGPIEQKIKPFFRRWVGVHLLTVPLLTHEIQDYKHYIDYIDKLFKHEKILKQLENNQYTQYAQDQFGVDIQASDCMTNEQYFAGLIH